MPSAPLAVTLPRASDPAARKAEIRKQLAPLCPAPMTAAELNDTANYLDAHRDAAPLAQRLLRFDKQTSICRTGKAL